MLILASASPRRKEILEKAGLMFRVIPAESESNPDITLAPGEYAAESALRKAASVSRKTSADDVVLGADTVVFVNGAIIGKPHDAADAFRMLRALSGKTHTVCTGFAIIAGDTVIRDHVTTEVTFRELDDAEISAYISTGEPMDKAGAYGIQGRGSVFVSSVNGDYFNVVGLPVCRVFSELKTVFGDMAQFMADGSNRI